MALVAAQEAVLRADTTRIQIHEFWVEIRVLVLFACVFVCSNCQVYILNLLVLELGRRGELAGRCCFEIVESLTFVV